MHWSEEELDYIFEIYKTGTQAETYKKFCTRYKGRTLAAYKSKAIEIGAGIVYAEPTKKIYTGVKPLCVFYREEIRRSPDTTGSCKLMNNEGPNFIENCGDCSFFQTIEDAQHSIDNAMKICAKNHPLMTKTEIYDHCHAEIAKRLIAGKKKDMERYPEAYRNGKNSNHNR